ncbi:S49 family peptidase [Chitinimonas koreensis]|uniref:S49 family peptidase n=1 Tax=Chitinimonas koreensis TaxID=356302 RepID=UPI0003FF221C|nr:S49 family peptidase [Chitinimonas koreensis]QNM94907.1 S49 family peptidase [Chitinimonas koreensis]
MRPYLHLASLLFNQPQLVTADMMDLAVHWANSHLNLNIVNVSVGSGAAPRMAFEDHGGADDRLAQQAESRQRAVEQTGVQVIPVHGLLVSRNGNLNVCETMTSYEQIRAAHQQALADPAVEEIVLDIDTPGGSAVGCFECAEDIFASRSIKRTTAVVNFGAYSGGYLLAAACNQIVVPPTGGTGSVGVVAKHIDISEALAQTGRKVTTIYAGAHKNDLTPTEPLSDQSRAVLEAVVQDSYRMFVDAVARYRAMTTEAVRATEAALYRGEQGVAVGFADRVETPHAALAGLVADVAGRRAASRPSRRIGMQAAAIAMQCS